MFFFLWIHVESDCGNLLRKRGIAFDLSLKEIPCLDSQKDKFINISAQVEWNTQKMKKNFVPILRVEVFFNTYGLLE